MADKGSWTHLESSNPELADTGRRLLYQGSDIASAYLATVAPDNGPRVHPIFPVLGLGELWLLVVNMSPKYRDLIRNSWFALHSLPTEKGGEEFYVRGHGELIEDQDTRARIVAATDGRQGTQDFEALIKCSMQSVLYTKWDNWGTAETWPNYTKWHS